MSIVIVGSGVAGVTCAEELAKAGRNVVLLTRESVGYYSRPLLSHGFSRADIEQQIVMRRFDELRQNGIQLHSNTEVLQIDTTNQRLVCTGEQGELLQDYETLVLAPGSQAFIPPALQPFIEHFYVLNSLADLISLRRVRLNVLSGGHQPRWAMIGGGLIGCEVASDLAKAGDNVTLFHVASRLMERQLQQDDSDALQHSFEQAGVAVELSCNVTAIETEGVCQTVVTAQSRHSGFHGIIVACGFKPRIELAQNAALPVQRGIMVDSCLHTADPHIYALGDAAQCADGRIYAFIAPIRSQAQWLARYLNGVTAEPWVPPTFHPKAKIHGFTASHPYQLP